MKTIQNKFEFLKCLQKVKGGGEAKGTSKTSSFSKSQYFMCSSQVGEKNINFFQKQTHFDPKALKS